MDEINYLITRLRDSDDLDKLQAADTIEGLRKKHPLSDEEIEFARAIEACILGEKT